MENTMKRILLIAAASMLLQGCGFWPPYNVWSTKLEGEAELAKAESTRKIAILEAQAKRDSAAMLAQAEIERAKGVSAANKIIAEGLRGHDEYLRYLWITEVAGKGVGNTVVYVPTEANLPILESQRLVPKAEPAAADK
jgi:regulator of protease activity HflC (stomatin/prohibitin superfamily)